MTPENKSFRLSSMDTRDSPNKGKNPFRCYKPFNK